MKSYMVNIGLPGDFTEEFVSLIPLQRMQVNILMQSGRLVSYAVSGDRKNLWMVVNAEDNNEVESLVTAMPLHKYMHIEELRELMFHERAVPSHKIALPAYSLN
jgi:muconolactone delta-isomerase